MARRRDAFDHKDSHGVVGYRGWLYSTDQDGNKIPACPATFEGMHVHPSHHYAPVPEGDLTEREMLQASRDSYDGYVNKLTDLEREVMYLLGNLQRYIVREEWIAAGDLAHRLNEGGCTYLPGKGKMMHDRDGLPSIELVCIESRAYEQGQPLDYEEVAALLRVTVAEVHRAEGRASQKRHRR